MINIKQDEIKQFVRNLITLGGGYVIDDEGYICSTTTDNLPPIEEDRIAYKVNGTEKYLVTYSDAIKQQDVAVINPFAEGISDTFEKNWFYSTRSIVVSSCIAKVMIFIVRSAIAAKGDKKTKRLNKELVELVSRYIEDIDDKTLSDIETLFGSKDSDMSEFFSIFYAKSSRTAKCCVGLFDSEFKAKPSFRNIRKKSWALFEKMLLELFDTEDFAEYQHQSRLKTCPNLEAFLDVMYRILSKIEPQLALAGIHIDLRIFKDGLPKLELYHQQAKWLVMPTALDVTPQNTVTPQIAQTTPTVLAGPLSAGMPQFQHNGLPSQLRSPSMMVSQPIGVFGQQPFSPMAMQMHNQLMNTQQQQMGYLPQNMYAPNMQPMYNGMVSQQPSVMMQPQVPLYTPIVPPISDGGAFGIDEEATNPLLRRRR